MKQQIRHIILRITGILLGVLAFTAVQAQKPVQYVEIPQCQTMDFSVDEWPGDRYTWDLYRDSMVNFATVKGDVEPAGYFEDGMYEGSTVTVHWLDTGVYFLRVMVWDETVCTNNLLVFKIKVLPNEPTLVFEGDSVCQDEVAYVKVRFTGMAPWEAHYSYTFEDQTVVLNLSGETDEEFVMPIPGLPVGTHEYWVMEVTDQCTVRSYPQPNPEKARVVIFPRPVSSQIKLKE
ncbi:MAG: hypothetical protein R2757_09085 [Draconibacterium sp.]